MSSHFSYVLVVGAKVPYDHHRDFEKFENERSGAPNRRFDMVVPDDNSKHAYVGVIRETLDQYMTENVIMLNDSYCSASADSAQPILDCFPDMVMEDVGEFFIRVRN